MDLVTVTFLFNPLLLPEKAFAPSTLIQLQPLETTAIPNVLRVNSQPIKNDPDPEPGPSEYDDEYPSDEYLTAATSTTNVFIT